MNKQTKLCLLVALVALSAPFVRISTASALRSISNPWPTVQTNTFVGQISPWGQYIGVIRIDTQQCRFYQIGDMNGLFDNYKYTDGGMGTWVNEVVAPATVNLCGYSLGPIVRGQYYGQLLGQGGDDRVEGGDSTDIWGGTGNDTVINGQNWQPRAWAGTGNDKMRFVGSSPYLPVRDGELYAEDGNDLVCSGTVDQVAVVDGGNGNDGLYGTARTVRYFEYQARPCDCRWY
ncbi:MAG: hypothetical protein JXA30_16155 [Deltaproteobacteria bacterium]|nr:hypothetical protein [Deltaproteobacteria bacterium]